LTVGVAGSFEKESSESVRANLVRERNGVSLESPTSNLSDSGGTVSVSKLGWDHGALWNVPMNESFRTEGGREGVCITPGRLYPGRNRTSGYKSSK
jgi:hypothetical protein